ncbi:asparagine synthase-related protein [Horticoccus sp. 23ND18S-11]|uniref:asparagine synthase-related protein n=1 Tax=Horticoccus sp. 23ND18S-11 TaxID=3391832 RepID=UPI0039C927A8
MSGLTGIIGPLAMRPESATLVSSMLRVLKHGPAAAATDGTIDIPQLATQAAWLNQGYEPGCVAWNGPRDVGLILSGEIYSIEGENTGAGLPSVSTVLQAYEKYGAAFVSRLNGRFSGLLIDARKGIVTLFNDRYGLNRVYLHTRPDACYFSSEAKSLLAVLPNVRVIDQQGLAEFFRVGCVLQNRSLFKDITLLPPASWWTVARDGTVQRQQYFSASTWENQCALSSQDYTDQLIATFSRILPRYFGGDAPVGISLTGGLDSRMILAWARAKAGTLPCYTFGGPYRDCADVQLARRLARLAQQPHTTLPIADDFFSRFAELARQTVYATDGTMDVSGAIELYANQKARAIAPIRVTGNYGSEILRANVAFRPGKIDGSLFSPEFLSLLDGVADTYRNEAAGSRLSFIAFKQVPWHHYGRFSAERSQLTPRSPFLDNAVVQLAYQAPRELEGNAQPILKLIATGNPLLDTIGSDRALRHRRIPVLSALQHRWQEFTAKAEYAYDYGMPSRFAPIDHRLSSLGIEKLFLGRHKFYHFRIWYKRELSHHITEILRHSDQLQPYREGVVQRILSSHLDGTANNTSALHRCLTIQLLSNTLLAAPSDIH